MCQYFLVDMVTRAESWAEIWIYYCLFWAILELFHNISLASPILPKTSSGNVVSYFEAPRHRRCTIQNSSGITNIS